LSAPEDRVRKIVQAIVDAAIFDHHEGREINSQSGAALRLRLNLIRKAPRRGDPSWYRELYHATRFLMKTEDE
jgi:hypothetical protein